MVARKAEPGQFIILRTDENGERIPLTVADYDRTAGTVTVIFQVVGGTTEKLNHMKEVSPMGYAIEQMENETQRFRCANRKGVKYEKSNRLF